MIIAHIEGATRVLGKRQGYLGLPVRDEVIVDKATGIETASITTAWEPTPLELSHLVAGGKIYLQILSSEHPPVMMWAEKVKINAL